MLQRRTEWTELCCRLGELAGENWGVRVLLLRCREISETFSSGSRAFGEMLALIMDRCSFHCANQLSNWSSTDWQSHSTVFTCGSLCILNVLIQGFTLLFWRRWGLLCVFWGRTEWHRCWASLRPHSQRQNSKAVLFWALTWSTPVPPCTVSSFGTNSPDYLK